MNPDLLADDELQPRKPQPADGSSEARRYAVRPRSDSAVNSCSRTLTEPPLARSRPRSMPSGPLSPCAETMRTYSRTVGSKSRGNTVRSVRRMH